MFCRKCGNQIPNDSVFCPKCGERCSVEVEKENGDISTDFITVNLSKSVTRSDNTSSNDFKNNSNMTESSNSKDPMQKNYDLLRGNTTINSNQNYKSTNSNKESSASKTAVVTRVISIVSLILAIILGPMILGNMDSDNELYGVVNFFYYLSAIAFFVAVFIRVICAFIIGSEKLELGTMIVVTIIILVIAIIIGAIFGQFAAGAFIFALALWVYCENKIKEMMETWRKKN